MKLTQLQLPFDPPLPVYRGASYLRVLDICGFIAKSGPSFDSTKHVGYHQGQMIFLLCPIHHERSPSLAVCFRKKNVHAFCFGCHKSFSRRSLGRMLKQTLFFDKNRWTYLEKGVEITHSSGDCGPHRHYMNNSRHYSGCPLDGDPPF